MREPAFDNGKMKGPLVYHTLTGDGFEGKDSLRKEVSPFNTRDRRFNFEFKSFRFEIDNGGTFVKIVEQTRNQNFVVFIDFGGVLWLIESLKKARGQVGNGSFFSKYKASYALFLLQRYNNKHGSFISLSKIQQSIVKRVVVFPAGKEGEGWLGIAGELHALLFDPPKRQQGLNYRSSLSDRGVTRKVMGNVRTGGKLTYAEAAKSFMGKKRSLAETVRRDGQQRKSGNFTLNVSDSKKGDVSGVGKTEQGLFVTNNNWYSVVVCIRKCLWDEWCDIQKLLNEMFKTSIVLHPFQPDKAAFCCKNVMEANMFGQKGILDIGNHFKVKLQGWNNGDLSIDKKVSCTGGWIEVLDLPLKWWTVEVFEEIGSKCGGLLQIDNRTKLMKQLFSARIKVKGRESGFIPDEIDMRIGSEKFTIKLKNVSTLDFSKRKGRTSTALDEFGRCYIDLEVEEDEPVLLEEGNEREKLPSQSQVVKESSKEVSVGGTPKLMENKWPSERTMLVNVDNIFSALRKDLGENGQIGLNQLKSPVKLMEGHSKEYSLKGKGFKNGEIRSNTSNDLLVYRRKKNKEAEILNYEDEANETRSEGEEEGDTEDSNDDESEDDAKIEGDEQIEEGVEGDERQEDDDLMDVYNQITGIEEGEQKEDEDIEEFSTDVEIEQGNEEEGLEGVNIFGEPTLLNTVHDTQILEVGPSKFTTSPVSPSRSSNQFEG